MGKVKGSVTVEAAVIVPFLLFLCVMSLHLLFYYHDKQIVAAAVHETVAYACGREGMDEGELEAHLKRRVKGKTMLLTKMETEVTFKGTQVSVCCEANQSPWELKIESVTRKTAPEVYIRSVRKLKKLEERMEEEP
jgi:hypothetical protein